jgi:predicted ATP-grasp superfamily ATP-dependent carboligase
MTIIMPTDLTDPVVVAAFEGWNDAGEAASRALDHLAELCDAQPVGEVDPEEFYDFQVNRPVISVEEAGVRGIEWRTTRVMVGSLDDDGADIVLIRGIEPNIRWRTFTEHMVQICQAVSARRVVLLGALLADTPHRRSLPVTGVSSSPDLAEVLRLDPASYTGPTGIVGVLAAGLEDAGLPVVSYWASVPYYVGQPPSPKATVALLRCVEDALDRALDLADLPEEAHAWERAVDEMVSDDEELAGIVTALEEQADSARLESASGDTIAAEFERYLRRRDPES